MNCLQRWKPCFVCDVYDKDRNDRNCCGFSGSFAEKRKGMDTLPVDPALLKALLKMLGITYVADFSASVCREAGYGSVAGQIELFAKLSIVALSIPELWVLLRLIEQMPGG